MVDVTLCERCHYSAKIYDCYSICNPSSDSDSVEYLGRICCDYIGYVGRMRPKSPGPDCPAFKERDGERRRVPPHAYVDVTYGAETPWKKEEK